MRIPEEVPWNVNQKYARLGAAGGSPIGGEQHLNRLVRRQIRRLSPLTVEGEGVSDDVHPTTVGSWDDFYERQRSA